MRLLIMMYISDKRSPSSIALISTDCTHWIFPVHMVNK